MKMQMERSWREVLRREFEQEYIIELNNFLIRERDRNHNIYPPDDEIFNSFRHTPFNQIKVVVVGQDPYHGPGQAHGLSFSVKKGIAPPPSLKNVFKELKSDIGIPDPPHGCLEYWAKQGVLLLNSTLTVRQGEPKSHAGRGWERFTDAVIESLCQRETPIIFLLWGKFAQEKCDRIFDVKKHSHAILKSSHPSPFSAAGFLGCKHFSKTNDLLEGWGESPIDWSVV